MGQGTQHVLCAQGCTRTSVAKKLKASFKEKHRCQLLLRARQWVCLIFPSTQSKAKMGDFKGFFKTPKCQTKLIHVCDSLADLSGTKLMLYFY